MLRSDCKRSAQIVNAPLRSHIPAPFPSSAAGSIELVMRYLYKHLLCLSVRLSMYTLELWRHMAPLF